ncbi:MAG: glycosyltransferase family 9 protein [Pyrinomonadaceae bacterium]
MTREDRGPEAENQVAIDWSGVQRVLVVRLRSIGDTVLSTPSLIALRRFLPHAQIDILLEDWVAPVLDGFDAVDNVITVGKGTSERFRTARRLRRRRYDVAFNLHGGTTATAFVRASGTSHRVGYANYQYSFLYDHLLTSASDFWKQQETHSAEQQLALLGFVGVPVEDRPKSRLTVTAQAIESLERKVSEDTREDARATGSTPSFERGPIALMHPGSAFFTKKWPTEKFARIAEFLSERGFCTIAVTSRNERQVLADLEYQARVPIMTLDDLTLPEVTALASKATLFVGNDSGIAHIAAAVGTPSVVIFGSSNRNHWRPWTDAPNEIVYEEFACQPCPGYECKEFGEPRCILSVTPTAVLRALESLLAKQ